MNDKEIPHNVLHTLLNSSGVKNSKTFLKATRLNVGVISLSICNKLKRFIYVNDRDFFFSFPLILFHFVEDECSMSSLRDRKRTTSTLPLVIGYDSLPHT